MAKRILTKDQEVQFNEWAEDGNVSKIDENKYLEHTTQWRKEFTLDELKAFFKREFLSDSYFHNGGSISDYKIFEGYDHYKSFPIYQVQGVGENEYVGDWHKDIKTAEKELHGLLSNKKFSGGGSTLNNQSFDYMLLNRLQIDNDYFLGAGNRHEKHLWAGSVDEQIKEMKAIWHKLRVKPEWLSMEDILDYETKMKRQFSDGGSIEQQNYAMIKSNNKQIMHHSKELSDVLKKNKTIPAWALALVNQSSQNLSNVTHYLEGAEKYATGGVSKKVFGDNVTFLDRVGNEQTGMVQDMDDKGAEIFYEERFIKVPTNRIVKFH
jgi:hypothetical protein